jgi:hypothetical protein
MIIIVQVQSPTTFHQIHNETDKILHSYSSNI